MARLSLPIAMLALSITPVLAAQAMDGWNSYKFGMSPDAVRAVPGQTFGLYSPKNLADEDVGSMAAKKEVPLNGRSYKMDLFFNASQKLSDVTLENQDKASQPDCEKVFLTLLGQMDKSYGGFAPVNAQHAKTEGDQLSASIVWKTQGPSRYELSTVYLDGETASSWKARKVAGTAFIDITTTWSGATNDTQATCLIDIDYSSGK